MKKADRTKKGMIFNIQKFSVNDGPGIEQLYFLKDVHFIVPGVPIQRVSIQKCRYYGIWKNVSAAIIVWKSVRKRRLLSFQMK